LSIGKYSQTHARSLTETAVSRRKSSRTIGTSSLCRSALATAVICSAPVTGAALPASADGGTGGDGVFAGASGNIVARTNQLDVEPV
jgi:hypothetical protein